MKKTETKTEGKKIKASKKPEEKTAEKKEKTSQENYEKRVVELAKEGLTSEKIGEKIRHEGMHPKEYNKKISHILIEKNIYVNPDLKNVEAKMKNISMHYEKNKQDKKAMREAQRVSSHLRKLKQYFGIKN